MELMLPLAEQKPAAPRLMLALSEFAEIFARSQTWTVTHRDGKLSSARKVGIRTEADRKERIFL